MFSLSVVSLAGDNGPDFDGAGLFLINIENADSISPVVPAPSRELLRSEKANDTHIFVASFRTKQEAESALPGLGQKLDASGCVILWSKIGLDAYGLNTWEVRISFLAPAGLTTEYYNGAFSDIYSASKALPIIVGKFEKAGYTVLTSKTYTETDAAGGYHYYANVSFISPNAAKPQIYNASFPTNMDAERALPGLVKKFEGVGYVVVNSWAGPSGYGDWNAGVAYITPR